LLVAEGTYQFNVGSFRCTAINDERGGDPPDGTGADSWTFVNASPEEVRAVFDAHQQGPNAWRNQGACTCLIVDTGRHKVLIDTGSGEQRLPELGQLLPRMREAGIAPEDIDVVLITHGHWDHIGANADANGAPTFPNARYAITHDEFRHWTETPSPFGGEIDEQGREYAEANLTALRNRFQWIEPAGEVVPGITTMPAPGHTPGQVAVLLQDGADRLFCTADTFHHPSELVKPDWYFDFDHDPATTVATRRHILDWAAREEVLVHVYHCPFPGLGRIVSEGDHWEWVRP